MIDFFVAHTLASLSGVIALIDHAERSTPEMESQVLKNLKEFAESEGWDYNDYDAERQGLEADYRHWIPKYNAYSAIILLCSVIETRLVACAGRVGKERKSEFRLRDIKGPPMEAASLYLKRVAALDVTADPAWPYLRDIQNLRNILVHRGGQRGDDPKHQKEFDELLARHSERLWLSENFGIGPEVSVSMRFCRASVEEAQRFFKRLFGRLGFRHGAPSSEAPSQQ